MKPTDPHKATRLQPKLNLVRRLKHYGYSSAEAGQIYCLIDWMITLPKTWNPSFWIP